jgi:hypothetical protein
MTKTLTSSRTARVAKSSQEVQAMLRDIATVLRLTAKVKNEMLREQAETDHQQLLANRAARLQAMESSSV